MSINTKPHFYTVPHYVSGKQGIDANMLTNTEKKVTVTACHAKDWKVNNFRNEKPGRSRVSQHV